MREFQLFIDGQWRPARSGRTAPTINPATEAPWATVAAAGREDVDDAVAAARRAFDDGRWRSKSLEERAAVLEAIAGGIFARQDELAAAEVADSGGTIRKANTADIPASAQTFTHYAELLRSLKEEEEFEESIPVPSRNIVRREPVGVVGAIIPWNFPMAAASWKIAPAIAAGNSLVLKPSPYTPVTALLLAEICRDAGVPPGVLNVIVGQDNVLGERLVEHPDVNQIAFTGSTKIGKQVMAACAPTLKRVILELGGKSPNIILEDADLDAATRGALFGTFFHSGQICESGTRVLVPRKLYSNFAERMVEGSKLIKVGDPADPMTTFGPLISRQQLDSVQRYVGLGLEEGAKLAAGGGKPKEQSQGYYHLPTIFTGVRNDMKVAREEIFGPVVALIPYDSEDEAVRLANDSMYGLGGAIWSTDTDRALAMARRIESGTVWINDYHLLNVRFPFGGYKQSGFGRELGPWGLAEYQQIKHIHVGQPTDGGAKFYFDMLLG
jgi:aldehyde dehydrogenase (NAD+)